MIPYIEISISNCVQRVGDLMAASETCLSKEDYVHVVRAGYCTGDTASKLAEAFIQRSVHQAILVRLHVVRNWW